MYINTPLRQAYTKGAFIEWLETNGGVIIILGSSFVIAMLFITMGFILFKKGLCAVTNTNRRSHPGLHHPPHHHHHHHGATATTAVGLDGLVHHQEGLQHYHQQLALAGHQFDVISGGGGGGGGGGSIGAGGTLQLPPDVGSAGGTAASDLSSVVGSRSTPTPGLVHWKLQDAQKDMADMVSPKRRALCG